MSLSEEGYDYVPPKTISAIVGGAHHGGRWRLCFAYLREVPAGVWPPVALPGVVPRYKEGQFDDHH